MVFSQHSIITPLARQTIAPDIMFGLSIEKDFRSFPYERVEGNEEDQHKGKWLGCLLDPLNQQRKII